MTSRGLKPLLVLLSALGIGLALAANGSAQPGAGLNWVVNGTGGGTVSPTMVSSSGSILSQFTGDGTYSLQISRQDAVGLRCNIARGSGTFTGSDGSAMNFNTVGLLCKEDSTEVEHYNGTFRITPGSGRFAAAAGSGDLAVIYESGSMHSLKADVTVTF